MDKAFLAGIGQGLENGNPGVHYTIHGFEGENREAIKPMVYNCVRLFPIYLGVN